MGIFDRIESKLERAYNGVFARAFRAEVQPVEIASAIRRAMDDKAAVVGTGVALVPNYFTIELSETDFERLGEFSDDLNDELIAAVEEHVDSQHYRPGGPLSIRLVEDVDLETGVFRVRPATAKRPHATGYTGQQPAVPRRVSAPPPIASPRAAPSSAAPPSVAPPPVASPPVSGPPLSRAGSAPGLDPLDHLAYDDDEDQPYDDQPYDDHRHEAALPPLPQPPRRVKPADRPWFDIDGDRYLLIGAHNIVGRDEAADVGLDDPGVSRRHAEVLVTVDGPRLVATIRDLGSTNGTFVNGDRITTAHLSDGDRVTMGRTSMIYRVRR